MYQGLAPLYARIRRITGYPAADLSRRDGNRIGRGGVTMARWRA